MLLSKNQAQTLRLPAEVWLEECGGYEGSRYRAEKVTAYEADDDAMFFLAHSGRAWIGYNYQYCGWRLWTEEPTLEERLSAKWNLFYMN